MIMTHRENIPFFNELQPKAINAASRLWDASHDPAYNGVQAYNDFVQDLTFAGITAPPRSVVKRWLAGVQSGLIQRPEKVTDATPVSTVEAIETPPKTKVGRKPRKPVGEMVYVPATEISSEAEKPILVDVQAGDDKPVTEVKQHFEKLTPATFGRTAFAPLLEAGIVPPEPDDERPDPALALIARQMIEEEVARINMNVRAQATANVAARLRQMALSLEGGAA